MTELAKVRSDLVAVPAEIQGETVYNLKDPRTGTYARLREPEYWILNQLDGQSTSAHIALAFQQKFDMNIGPGEIDAFVAQMDSLLFLENVRSEQAGSRTVLTVGKRRSLIGRLLFIKLRAFKPGKTLERLTRFYQPLHHPITLALAGLVVLVGLGIVFANLSAFHLDLQKFWSVGSIIGLVVSLFLLITLHEYAHAVTCRMHGGEVREIGFLLLYFQPCFYCDLSDAWLFKKKSHRLAVTFAGPLFQLFLLALTAIAWRLTQPGSFVNHVCWMLITVNWVAFLLNFNPLIKLDGYYILSDWLDIPNLRSKAFAYLGNSLKRRLLGWTLEPIDATPRERKVFIRYGALALIYSAGLLAYLGWIAATFTYLEFGPAGLLLFALVVLYILRESLVDLGGGVVTHLHHMKGLLKKPVRLTVYVVVLTGLGILALAVPFPRYVSGEVTIRAQSTYSLLMNDLGLLEGVYRQGGAEPEVKTSFIQMASSDLAALKLVPRVRNAQAISSGDTIAALLSNQVDKELEAASAELDRLVESLALLRAPPKAEAIDEAEARVKADSTNFEQLKRDFDRVEQLVNRGLETEEKREAKESEVAVAAAELSRSQSSLRLLKSPPRPEEESVIEREIQKQRAQLKYLTEQAAAQHIISPIPGLVRLSSSGDREFLRISDVRWVEIEVPVSDFDIDLLKPGQPARIKVRSYPARTFDGSVVRIPMGATSDTASGSFSAFLLVENANSDLRPGMTGYAKIGTGSTTFAELVFRKLLSLLRVEFWSWL